MPRPTNAEINEQIALSIETDGKLFGMTYEQGVREALEWVLGLTEEKPIPEDE